ncbi:MAG: 1,4-dihydroxy-2-naphthoate octaprenyltransferase [Bacteroidetes bacterium]|nr:1,4-dihydroxy-2-naphthoate octaprenyltransferase [Bacteroidota bacterium]
MNPWIQAARLRTLPLALSGILLGAALSYMCNSAIPHSENNFSGVSTDSVNPAGIKNLAFGIHVSPSIITLLAILTATALQVLSNYANDYGDFRKGTDTKAKRSDRALASGKISEKSMKRALWILSLFTLLLGVLLIYSSGLFQTQGGFYLLGVGLFALFAAISYTVGKNAYGYMGLGDVFVLVFFGLVPVWGMGLLNGLFIDASTSKYLDVFVMAGLGLGLLSVGVLNVNNYRDILTDKEQNKKTLAVRLGVTKTIIYHKILLLMGGLLLPSSFLIFEKRYFQWPEILGLQSVFLIGIFSPTFLLLSSHFRSVKAAEPGDRETLNPQLKKLSLTILSMVLLYGFLALFILDF